MNLIGSMSLNSPGKHASLELHRLEFRLHKSTSPHEPQVHITAGHNCCSFIILPQPIPKILFETDTPLMLSLKCVVSNASYRSLRRIISKPTSRELSLTAH